MESLQNIFIATITQSKDKENLQAIICEVTYELSKKKIKRLRDKSRIQARLNEIFELFIHLLKNEDLATKENIESVILGLIKSANSEKEELLYNTIYEKEELEKKIEKQKQDIRESILESFDNFERSIEKLEGETKEEFQKALGDAKLKGIEMLGILKETVSEALITTLEKAKEIEDTSYEITKNITYQAINEGKFLKKRFIDISQNIIEVAIDIADSDQANAKELLSGVILGTKEGMAKAIDKFKNDLKFAPEDFEDELLNIKKELINIEEDFIEMLEKTKDKSSGVSKEIIAKIIDEELNSALAKVRRVTNEAVETVTQKIEELKLNSSYLDSEFVKKAEKKIEEFEKIAEEKVEKIKNSETTKKVTTEAKRIGNHAWKLAKGVVEGAIKGAKDVMK